MLEEVYKWIQNIADIIIVVVTAMLHAVPGKKNYEKIYSLLSCR